MTVLEREVKQAASWLDEREPGWAEKINTETLSVEHADRCIGYQLHGNTDAWKELSRETGLDDAWAHEHANPAWIAEVNARRN